MSGFRSLTNKRRLLHRDHESRFRFSILTLLSKGLVKKEIANDMGISYPTVDSHVSHIYEKLNVHNAPSAINVAHRLGLFPPSE
ncbi:LuxR C-terminal-related transcriptional regulator [Akkermansiaceae bacterium]|nr:LuxR C-terminal-related transcriptional regulator [Akkermansiaceae bacterium]